MTEQTVKAGGEELAPLPLPSGVTEDYVDCSASCGLVFHVLKAGEPGKPLVLFTHGFPELAYSWRHILPRIAEAGNFFCVAVDQRGYGRTRGLPGASATTTDGDGEADDLADYVFTNLVRDLVCLVFGLGYAKAHSIVGHDFGAASSAMAALMRPDVFASTVQMSHPHQPLPAPPKNAAAAAATIAGTDIQAALASLDPPRKHYKWYSSSSAAVTDWDTPPQGLEAFLRGYFHLKSADWGPNALAGPLPAWSASDLAAMPEYYIMRAEDSMPASVARNMAVAVNQGGENPRATERWLPEAELRVYCAEWRRTGFRGALNWYRAQTASGSPRVRRDLLLFSGRRIEVPCVFISGRSDWGNYQQPGALEAYDNPRSVLPGMFRGVKLVDGAGHWVQQEQPDAVVKELLDFFKSLE